MEYKTIFKSYLARQLLKMGNPIADIKPDREREGRTIFIFETTEKFKNDLSTLLSE
jgi:hypothetical protein